MSHLTNNDINEFMFFLYFGSVKDPLKASIEKSYLDFNRTLHGFSGYPNKKYIIEENQQILYEEIGALLKRNIYNQEGFDKWHKDLCDALIENFRDFKFHYGQAQKWINMTFKYLFILDRDSLKSIYQFLHIPIDNIIISNLKNYNAPIFQCAWSRIDDYYEYIKFQKWFREKFEGNPLDNEFKLFLGKILKSSLLK